MERVSESTVLAAPVEDVFAFLDEPANQATVTPGITEAERVERLENGGNRARYTYEMAGVELTGEVVATTYEPDGRIVYDVRGDVEGTIDWTFESAASGTRFTYGASYELPGPVLDRVAGPVLRRYNRRQVLTTVTNLEAEFGTP